MLVPNSFYRHGPAPLVELPEYIAEVVRPAVFAQLMPLIEAHTAERVLSDAEAYLRFFTTQQPEFRAGPGRTRTSPSRSGTSGRQPWTRTT